MGPLPGATQARDTGLAGLVGACLTMACLTEGPACWAAEGPHVPSASRAWILLLRTMGLWSLHPEE